MTLRYGLIGCGMMGQEHIRNIELLDDTQITVVFEPDAQMRAARRRPCQTPQWLKVWTHS